MATSEAVLRLLLDDRQAKSGIKNTEKMVDGLGEKLAKSAVVWNQTLELAAKGARMAKAAFLAAEEAALTMDAQRVLESTGVAVHELEQATGNLISKAQLIRKAGLAQQMGINAQSFAQLAEIAVAASKKTGQSVDFMLDSIVVGTARGSKQILDNLGILMEGAFSMEKVLESGKKMVDEVAKAGANASDEFARARKSISDFAHEVTATMVPAFNKHLLPALRTVFEFWSEIFGLDTARTRAEKAAESNAAAIEKLSARLNKLKRTLELVERGVFDFEDVWRAGYAGIAADAQSLEGVMGGLEMAIADVNAEMDKLRGKTPGIVKPPPAGGDDKPKPDDDKPKPEATSGQVDGVVDLADAHVQLYEDEKKRRAEAAYWAQREQDTETATQLFLARIRKEAHERANRLREEAHRAELRRIDEERRAAETALRERRNAERRAKDERIAEAQETAAAVQGFYAASTGIAFQAIEGIVAGQERAFERALLSFMQMIGGQVVGIGFRTIAEGMSMNAVVPGSGSGTIAQGVAIVGAGTAMGGAGAVWAGAIRRGEGGASGGVSIEASPRSPFGGEARQRARDRGQVNISPGAIVLGDLSAAASGIQNAMQRGGRFLLGVG